MRRLRELIAAHRTATVVVVAVLTAVIGVSAWLGVRASRRDVMPLEQVFKQYQEYLLNLPGVVSVGIGELNGRRFIQVYARSLTPRVRAQIPRTLGGWKVRLQRMPDPEPKPESPSPSPSPTGPPDPSSVTADVRGTITAVTRLAEPQGGVLGWIIVEGVPGPDTGWSEASVAITADTQFYVLEGADLRQTDVAFGRRELRGEMVEVEFAGRVTGGDPVQASAAVVIFTGSATERQQ
jgi:hypothetical protein